MNMSVNSYTERSRSYSRSDVKSLRSFILSYIKDIDVIREIDDKDVLQKYKDSLKKSSQYHVQLNKFRALKVEYPEYVGGFENNADKAFHISINKLLELKPENLFTSITNSKSIFYTFSFENGFKIRLEIFYEDEQLETAYTCYKLSNVIARNFGDLNYILDDIKKILTEECNNYNISTADYSYSD